MKNKIDQVKEFIKAQLIDDYADITRYKEEMKKAKLTKNIYDYTDASAAYNNAMGSKETMLALQNLLKELK